MAKGRILVVEDESIVAMEIQDRLKSLGYDVCAAVHSGEEAVQKAEETNPDLALMDIMLKGDMDGVAAAEQIKNRFDVPVIYLTAYADDNTLQRAKITSPYGYIIKPFEERELHINIEMALYKHRTEKKLKENERWLSTTLKSIGDAVITTDTNGAITFMNAVAGGLTGWGQEDALGKDLTEIFKIINEDADNTFCHQKGPAQKVAPEDVIAVTKNRASLISRAGTKISIDYNFSPIKDDKGNIDGDVLVFRDITKKQKIEEEIQKIQKLESIGALAGGIAHDYNNILTVILGNISLAKLYAQPTDELFELLTEAEKASNRAKDLTRQLITFSKGGSPIRKTASISKLIKGSAALSLSGSNVKRDFSIPEDLWPVEVDEIQMAQALNNLIINAVQAMPEGGSARLEAENAVIEAEQALPLTEGRYIKITIKDQGMGIPKENLDKIFDPFFTTKQMGDGLGLAITYSVIKKHSGYISVESEQGKGTTFFIYLPASTQRNK